MINKATMTIGTDYSGLMGLTGTGTKMIYNGGISWTVIRADGAEMTADSQAQTDSIRAKIESGDVATF